MSLPHDQWVAGLQLFGKENVAGFVSLYGFSKVSEEGVEHSTFPLAGYIGYSLLSRDSNGFYVDLAPVVLYDGYRVILLWRSELGRLDPVIKNGN